MSFGTRLKEKREALGITQPQLAEMLNVSKGAIGNWETDVNSPTYFKTKQENYMKMKQAQKNLKIS